MKQFLFSVFFFSTLVGLSQNRIDYNKVSQNLLQSVIEGEPHQKEIATLANSTLNELVQQLKTDQQKIAFWVNIYNSFIQISLSENLQLYENKSKFFSNESIKIAGEFLSFDDIEHGIIRKSKIKLSLGYLKKWFIPKWEQELRVKNIDWRIHFALNCGAKSCPPVAIYTPKNLGKELDFMTSAFLKHQTTYNTETKTANTTSLFSWFRGDFGGIAGVKKILKDYKITSEKPKNIDFNVYDWTVLLGNYSTITK